MVGPSWDILNGACFFLFSFLFFTYLFLFYFFFSFFFFFVFCVLFLSSYPSNFKMLDFVREIPIERKRGMSSTGIRGLSLWPGEGEGWWRHDQIEGAGHWVRAYLNLAVLSQGSLTTLCCMWSFIVDLWFCCLISAICQD